MSSADRPAIRCSQTTIDGSACRAYAVHGSDRCSAHLGRVGRKTLLSPELSEQLVQMLRAGNYVQVACRACGIGRQTFAEWMSRARSGEIADAPYRELRERVEEARAEGEVRNVTVIAKAARDGDWRAALAMLEREYPERWGPVSVRVREIESPLPELPATPAPDDPFAEVDELAERRRGRAPA